MPRRDTKPKVRAHFWVFNDDLERLHKYFDANIGMSTAVRTILHNYLNSIESQALEIAGAQHLAATPQALEAIIGSLSE